MNQDGIILNGFVYTQLSNPTQKATPQASERVSFDRATTAIQIEDFADKVLSAITSTLWREVFYFKVKRMELNEIRVTIKIVYPELNDSRTHTLVAQYVDCADKLSGDFLNATSAFSAPLRLSLYQDILHSKQYRNER